MVCVFSILCALERFGKIDLVTLPYGFERYLSSHLVLAVCLSVRVM